MDKDQFKAQLEEWSEYCIRRASRVLEEAVAVRQAPYLGDKVMSISISGTTISYNVPFNWRTYRELRHNMGRGWREIHRDELSEDFPFDFFDVKFSHQDHSYKIKICMHMPRENPDGSMSDRSRELAAAGVKCRRVQVGVKTVEQPVYKTICD